jgi:hypothetical protein
MRALRLDLNYIALQAHSERHQLSLSLDKQLLYRWNQPLLLKQQFGNCPPRPTINNGKDITLISLELLPRFLTLQIFMFNLW